MQWWDLTLMSIVYSDVAFGGKNLLTLTTCSCRLCAQVRLKPGTRNPWINDQSSSHIDPMAVPIQLLTKPLQTKFECVIYKSLMVAWTMLKRYWSLVLPQGSYRLQWNLVYWVYSLVHSEQIYVHLDMRIVSGGVF